jgi:aspartate-semialdehyde dehydrogenase
MFRVALAGATGAVGGTMLRVLEERGFPVSELRPLASTRSEGRELHYLGKPFVVRTLSDDAFEGIDIALFSAGATRSRAFAPAAVAAGAVVIDNSSAFRMDPDVPLVVPEVNEAAIREHRGIIANPNCVSAPLVVALKPIADAVGLERVIVASYQSVSGTGQAGVEELRAQVAAQGNGAEPEPAVYPHPIFANVLPHIGDFDDEGHTGEEVKVVEETRKMLGLPDLPVSATCVRVPVYVGHSEAVVVETTEPIDPERARELLMVAPGVALVDEPAANRYPLPRDAAGRDEVFVGRVRRDPSHPRGLAMWIVADNLRKGAATNAVQIAESLVTNGWLHPEAGRAR